MDNDESQVKHLTHTLDAVETPFCSKAGSCQVLVKQFGYNRTSGLEAKLPEVSRLQ